MRKKSIPQMRRSLTKLVPPFRPDFYELRGASPLEAIRGIVLVFIVVMIQIVGLFAFFFYGNLLNNVIFDGASIDFSKVMDALGNGFMQILYLPVIIVAVYGAVFLIQLIVEKFALSGDRRGPDDANRALSLEERKFIEKNIGVVSTYREASKYPSIYPWLYWLGAGLCIASFLAFPALIIWVESEFFNAIKMSGISEDEVIAYLGPAFVGGAVTSFLFGAMIVWSGWQWLGGHYPKFGEYCHSHWGWNSMDGSWRSDESYAKILTRFIRKRIYHPDEKFEPHQFIQNAFQEHAGFIYRTTIVLGVATVLFTALDVNWRRVTHTGGLHYSPYLDWRAYDLTLDDVVEVQVKCFLYNEGDDGEREPGAGYDVVFLNGMRGYLFDGEIDGDLLTKVEFIDAELRQRSVPVVRAQRAGDFFLRGINGYWPDCAETVLPRYNPEVRGQIARC